MLSPDQVKTIRRRYAAKEATQRELAQEYGLTQVAISLIVRCESYGVDGKPGKPGPGPGNISKGEYCSLCDCERCLDIRHLRADMVAKSIQESNE